MQRCWCSCGRQPAADHVARCVPAHPSRRRAPRPHLRRRRPEDACSFTRCSRIERSCSSRSASSTMTRRSGGCTSRACRSSARSTTCPRSSRIDQIAELVVSIKTLDRTRLAEVAATCRDAWRHDPIDAVRARGHRTGSRHPSCSGSVTRPVSAMVNRAGDAPSIRRTLLGLRQYRHLLRNLVLKDLKLKYRGSVVGFLWSLANPLVMASSTPSRSRRSCTPARRGLSSI